MDVVRTESSTKQKSGDKNKRPPCENAGFVGFQPQSERFERSSASTGRSSGGGNGVSRQRPVGQSHNTMKGRISKANAKPKAACRGKSQNTETKGSPETRSQWTKPLHVKSEEVQKHPPGRSISRVTANGKLSTVGAPTSPVLFWPSSRRDVPLSSEESLLKVIFRWENEKGMMKDQPPFRLKDVKNRCRLDGVELIQALSLRRTHLKLKYPYRSMDSLRLGRDEDIRQSAILFEEAVAEHLERCQLTYRTEEVQKEEFEKTRQPGDRMPPTPDFVISPPARLASSSRGHWNGREIHWIDAKMFYGASTIPHETKNAVGTIREKVIKYVSLFGPGAIVFSYGCGDQLASELSALGVVALDASPIDLSRVEEHQRSWCANEMGEILP